MKLEEQLLELIVLRPNTKKIGIIAEELEKNFKQESKENENI